MRSDAIATDQSVTVIGRETVDVSLDTLADLPSESCTAVVDCSSGEEYTASWTGVSLASLLEFGSPSPETTHVAVEGADGFRICVDVGTAFGGILALERDGRAIAESNPYATRFIAPTVSGTRTTKDVRTIETLSLAAGDDPTNYETIGEISDESSSGTETETDTES